MTGDCAFADHFWVDPVRFKRLNRSLTIRQYIDGFHKIFHSNSLQYAPINGPYLRLEDSAMFTQAYARGPFEFDSIDTSTNALISLRSICVLHKVFQQYRFWSCCRTIKSEFRDHIGDLHIINPILDLPLATYVVYSNRYALVLAFQLMWRFWDRTFRSVRISLAVRVLRR